MMNWRQYSISIKVKDSPQLQEFKEALEYSTQIMSDRFNPQISSEEFYKRYPQLIDEEIWDD